MDKNLNITLTECLPLSRHRIGIIRGDDSLWPIAPIMSDIMYSPEEEDFPTVVFTPLRLHGS